MCACEHAIRVLFCKTVTSRRELLADSIDTGSTHDGGFLAHNGDCNVSESNWAKRALHSSGIQHSHRSANFSERFGRRRALIFSCFQNNRLTTATGHIT